MNALCGNAQNADMSSRTKIKATSVASPGEKTGMLIIIHWESGHFDCKLLGGDVVYEYTREELEEAVQIVSSTIGRCEKAQPKFVEGTSQNTLLKNRIKALYISKLLITHENVEDKYTKEELVEALRPVASIISKCEKAQLKFTEGTSHHTRFRKMIKAMYISKSLITDEIIKRGNALMQKKLTNQDKI